MYRCYKHRISGSMFLMSIRGCHYSCLWTTPGIAIMWPRYVGLRLKVYQGSCPKNQGLIGYPKRYLPLLGHACINIIISEFSNAMITGLPLKQSSLLRKVAMLKPKFCRSHARNECACVLCKKSQYLSCNILVILHMISALSLSNFYFLLPR